MKRAIMLYSILLCLAVVVATSGKLHHVEGKEFPHDEVIETGSLSATQTDIFLPDVTVLEPAESPTRTGNENVRLRALIRSRLPLIGLTVMRNGAVLHKVKIDGSFHERSRYILDIMIPLQRGANSISILANNEKASSKPDNRDIFYEPAAQTKPNLRVLAIGVSKLTGPRLSSKFASADAQAFAKTMSTQAIQGSLFASVDTKTLLDDDATRQAILVALKWLNGSAGSDNDVRVLFLSGTLATDYIDNAPYFLTSQFEPKADLAIGNVRLTSFWQILAYGNGQTLIFANTDWAEGEGRYSVERFYQFGEEDGFNNFFASRDGMTVSSDPTWTHSAFTTALLEGLDGKADLALSGAKDGIIDTHELQMWIRSRVEELTGGKQLPAIQVGQKRVPMFKLTSPR